ncbi:unnamed protein product [Arctogadus glacialis]
MEGRTLSDLGHSQEPQFVSPDNRARPKVPRLEPSAVSWWSPRGARRDPGARLQMPVFTIRHLRALSTESSSAG